MPKLSSFPVASDPLGSGDYLIGNHTVLGVTTDVKYSISLLPQQIQSDWNAVSGIAQIANKPTVNLDYVLGIGNTSTNSITLTDAFASDSLNMTSSVIRMYGTPGNKNTVIQAFSMYVCSDGLNYGLQMTTSNDGSMNYLQFTQGGILGQIQSSLLSSTNKVWQLPNKSGTFAMLSDITATGLDAVLSVSDLSTQSIHLNTANPGLIVVQSDNNSETGYNYWSFNQGANSVSIIPATTITGNYQQSLPNKSGTFAMLSDTPYTGKAVLTGNGTNNNTFTVPSGYNTVVATSNDSNSQISYATVSGTTLTLVFTSIVAPLTSFQVNFMLYNS